MEHKPYVRPQDRFWFLRHAAYRKYMLREASSIFIGLWMLNLLFGILRLSQGEAAWSQWLAWQETSYMIAFSLITLVMAMIHTLTWFSVAPKAMPKYVAGKQIQAQQVVIVHWALFALLSVGLIIVTILEGSL